MRSAVRIIGVLVLGLGLLAAQYSLPNLAAQTPPVEITDIFGRTINQHGITLVDWEGMIRNPALRLFVNIPDAAQYPVSVTIEADHPRIYFNNPAFVSEFGPLKVIDGIAEGTVPEFFISIFPDRDFEDEEHLFTIEVVDQEARGFLTEIPIRVIDQDIDRAVEYPLIVDFSQDQTGLFDDAQTREVAEAAAADWAYFLADMSFDTVPAQAELTNLPTATRSGDQEIFGDREVRNDSAYNGFLLYGIGWDFLRGPEDDGPTSTGFASVNSLQTRNGAMLPIRRSGVFAMNIHGNFNTNGWRFSLEDDDWFDVYAVADFYQIVSHEMGHALFYYAGYPLYAEAASFVGGRGFFEDPELLAYHGSNPTVVDEHLNDGYVDRLSLQAPYGGGHGPYFELGRGMITKLDLLIIKSIGYELRETSPFVPLTVGEDAILDGRVSVPYMAQLQARGGVPIYHWEHISGELPDGLDLTAFGELEGTPQRSGIFNFTLEVRDYDEQGEPVQYEACVKINNADGSDLEENCPPPMSVSATPPIADRDGDGVPDDEDLCPDFAGRPEESGC